MDHQSRNERPINVGLLGFGAIGSEVAKYIHMGLAGNCVLRAVLVQTLPRTIEEENIIYGRFISHHDDKREFDVGPLPSDSNTGVLTKRRKTFSSATEKDNIVLTKNLQDFLLAHIDVCIEVAGQSALREFGPALVDKGIDLVATSIGAFTDDGFRQRMMMDLIHSGADNASGKLFLCSGAMPGLDWMQSASCYAKSTPSSEKVTLIQVKPPHSWRGTPAEDKFDLDKLTEYTVLHSGTAREVASRFPKNSNVACMLALATIGVDRVLVELATDPRPGKQACSSTVEYWNEFVGKLRIEVSDVRMLESNPKTSAEVPLSVVKTLKNYCGGVWLGA